MKESRRIKLHKLDIPGRGIVVFVEYSDGTFTPDGTSHVYNKDQYEIGKAKMIAAGAIEVK